MYYTGIGARKTPKRIQDIMTDIAKYLSKQGWILRSGHAQGADQAFERGCLDNSEIYLPWKGFEGSDSDLIVKEKLAFDIAEKHHPYWRNLSQGAKKLQARNSHQIFGKDLKSPSSFVICWTEGGKMVGGTAQALRIAESWNIPIFNLGKYEDLSDSEITDKVMKFLSEWA